MAYKANGKTRLEWAASMVGKPILDGRFKIASFTVDVEGTGVLFHTHHGPKLWRPWPKDCKEDCQ